MRPALSGLATVVALYGLYASAGSNVLGFLSGYGSEEGLDDGQGLWLLAGLGHVTALPSWASKAYALGVLLIYAAIAVRMTIGNVSAPGDAVRMCRGAAILAAFATAAISPHYPWYFPWVALPCVVAFEPVAVWLSSVPVLLYVDPFHDRFLWPALVYLPALGILASRLWASAPGAEMRGAEAAP